MKFKKIFKSIGLTLVISSLPIASLSCNGIDEKINRKDENTTNSSIEKNENIIENIDNSKKDNKIESNTNVDSIEKEDRNNSSDSDVTNNEINNDSEDNVNNNVNDSDESKNQSTNDLDTKDESSDSVKTDQVESENEDNSLDNNEGESVVKDDQNNEKDGNNSTGNTEDGNTHQNDQTSEKEDGIESNDSNDQNEGVNAQENNSTDSLKYIYDIENKYYSSADGLSGRELLNQLTRIQKSHFKSIKGYDQLKNFYNKTNAFRDIYFEKDNTILDVYSENPSGIDPYNFEDYVTNGGRREGDGTNREHMIPQSWFNKQSPMKSDGQFVWPTDIKVNNMRSNFPHGIVSNVTKVSKNGSKLGRNNRGNTVFEPVDQFKGDIARTYLYFIATYNDKNIRNGNSIFTTSFPYINEHFLEVYKIWDKQDSVDIFDVTRNNQTAKYQKIRNPFIDYPDLYENIFGENPKPFKNKGVLIKINQ
ncbi:endonuclease [Mycoplasma sp. OR1901]|uniref:endonuclease n=1 Tax=Mycoplasma sp. OR1901 TaxID=2742195 RepID=UPI00158309FE|nr:endonuclease [Mycoplasma sp. OR1901]QKT05730.1 endonuclease [Mycoplasma sp. OR1901]